ncbi:hypothetical protein MTO96_021233 [Rhipicephalus appendiculatus]
MLSLSHVIKAGARGQFGVASVACGPRRRSGRRDSGCASEQRRAPERPKIVMLQKALTPFPLASLIARSPSPSSLITSAMLSLPRALRPVYLFQSFCLFCARLRRSRNEAGKPEAPPETSAGGSARRRGRSAHLGRRSDRGTSRRPLRDPYHDPREGADCVPELGEADEWRRFPGVSRVRGADIAAALFHAPADPFVCRRKPFTARPSA